MMKERTKLLKTDFCSEQDQSRKSNSPNKIPEKRVTPSRLGRNQSRDFQAASLSPLNVQNLSSFSRGTSKLKVQRKAEASNDEAFNDISANGQRCNAVDNGLRVQLEVQINDQTQYAQSQSKDCKQSSMQIDPTEIRTEFDDSKKNAAKNMQVACNSQNVVHKNSVDQRDFKRPVNGVLDQEAGDSFDKKICENNDRNNVLNRLNKSQSLSKSEIQSKDQEFQYKQKVDHQFAQDNQRTQLSMAKLKPFIPSKKMHSIYVMYINSRVRMQFPSNQLLSNILAKFINFFGIENHDPSSIGLVYRIKDKNYRFIEQECDLMPDCLYFLYFKDSVASKKNMPIDGLLPQILDDQDKGCCNQSGSDEDLCISDDEIKCSKKMEKSLQRMVEEDKSGRQLKFTSSIEKQKDAEFQLDQLESIKDSKRRPKNFDQNEFDLTCIQRVKRPKNEIKLLMCPFVRCLKEFSETGNLKTHMRTHTGERPFKCTQCNQFFITKGHLQAHELTHTGQKPFVCNFHGCNKRYSRAGRLKIHARLHTGEKPFQCQLNNCEKSFREKGNLLTHMRMHQNQSSYNSSAPYNLNECSRQVNYQIYKKSCKCQFCGSSFPVVSELRDHQKKHCLKCNVCGRVFQEINNYNAHKMTHTNQTYEQPSMSSAFQNYLAQNFEKNCQLTGSVKEDEYLQTFDENIQQSMQNRRNLKRKSKENAKVQIAETFNDYGSRREQSKYQNDEVYSCHQSSSSLSHQEPSKTLTFHNNKFMAQEKSMIADDKNFQRDKSNIYNPECLAFKQGVTAARQKGQGVNQSSPDLTDKFSIFAPAFHKGLVNSNDQNRNEAANQVVQGSMILHAQNSSNSISNLIDDAQENRRACFQMRNPSAQGGQVEHQLTYHAPLPFLSTLERQVDYHRDQVLSPSVILGRQQTFGPMITNQNQNGSIREEQRHHYSKNLSSLFPQNNENLLKSIISPLHAHSEEAEKEKMCMGQPRTFIHALNLTQNRVMHQQQMGHDSDYRSELSGLANNSQGDHQWPSKDQGFKTNYQHVLDALCDQLARQQEIEGQQFDSQLNMLAKPHTDDNKQNQNMIASPVYVYKQQSHSEKSMASAQKGQNAPQRTNQSPQEIYEREQAQRDNLYHRSEKIHSEDMVSSKQNGESRPQADQKHQYLIDALTDQLQQKSTESKLNQIQLQKGSSSSPILPISIMQEHQSEMLGLPVSHFSGVEDQNDEIREKRAGTHYTDGANILSPAQEIGSLENISPGNKQLRLQNNQKIVLNYPNKYFPSETRPSGSNLNFSSEQHPCNLKQNNFCDQQMVIEAFQCQNQISGSTKPHTAKRSPELVQSDLNQK